MNLEFDREEQRSKKLIIQSQDQLTILFFLL